jgi:hypothetical protein
MSGRTRSWAGPAPSQLAVLAALLYLPVEITTAFRSDMASQLSNELKFNSVQEAKAYCQRQGPRQRCVVPTPLPHGLPEDVRSFVFAGFEFEIQEEQLPVKKVKAYSDNFKFKGVPSS